MLETTPKARSVGSTRCSRYFHTECVHLRPEPHWRQGGAQLLVQGMAVTEWRRRGQTGAEPSPGCKASAPQGGEGGPEDTQKGAPLPPPGGLPGHDAGPALHPNPLQPHREQQGWEGREPLEREPQVRRQSALQTNQGPYTEPVLDPGPWVGGASHYQKAGASTHKGECNPLKEDSGPRRIMVLWFSREVCFLPFISQGLWQEGAFSSGGWFQKSQGSWGTVPPSPPIQQPGAEVSGPFLSSTETQEAAPARALRPERLAPLSELQSGLRGHLR